MRIVECVPNFSEGHSGKKIGHITSAIQSVSGVKLLHTDRGRAAARTVMTFAGELEAVLEAAFRAVRAASEVIDMRAHQGEHPRIGATDVLPLIPVSGITLAELVPYVRTLGQRIGDELGIPIYMYEASATAAHRTNLEQCRHGQYECLREKITKAGWKPDFGPTEWSEQVAKSGLTVLGARDLLVAVNFNLDTTSAKVASAIAREVRQSGYLDSDGVRIAGTLPAVKAIGWYIQEYGRAQVSTNLTNVSKTSLHRAFNEISRVAALHGTKVTGTELIGLVPLKVMLNAGRSFFSSLDYRNRIEPSQDDLIGVAIARMGLDELAPFDPNDRIIERMLTF